MWFIKKAIMILLLSEERDITSTLVALWLLAQNVDYTRINSLQTLEEKILLKHNKFSLMNKDVKSLWFRRVFTSYITRNKIDANYKEFRKYLIGSSMYFLKNLSSFSDNSYQLGNPYNTGLSKLKQFQIAEKLGMKVPKTILTNNKEELKRFKREIGRIVMKPLQEAVSFFLNDKSYISYTKKITDAQIESFPDTFFPCTFQEQIDKDFEIRAFFIESELYSIAMFTQENDNTLIDSRNLDDTDEYRCVPMKLPNEISNKIEALMLHFGLNTGVLDLIFFEGEFTFLEINPVGQFGSVSHFGNYGLEKRIAQKLIAHGIG